jgi:hypothetical protein
VYDNRSPLGAYITDDNSDESYVQVLDVNDTYGTYLVPLQRLYDAINTYGTCTPWRCNAYAIQFHHVDRCIDLSNGKSRGLIRIELA